MTKPRTNPAQDRAIASEGNLLVVAGAGTGKTLTLVQRCVRLLAGGRCAIGEILLVTFTEAAAAEMRDRLRKGLSEASATATDPQVARHLQHQLAMLDTAHIGTLHSFCLKLIRQHFHELVLDPRFHVLDPSQTRPLMTRTLDELFASCYAAETVEAQAVRNLVLTLGRGDDVPLRNLIRRIHTYTQSLHDPETWLAGQERMLAQAEPAQWRGWVLEGLKTWVAEWRTVLSEFENLPGIQRCLRELDSVGANPSADLAAIARAVACINAVDKDKSAKVWPPKCKGPLKEVTQRFWKDAAFLEAALTVTDGADPLAQDWQWVVPPLRTLLRLTREFTSAFTAHKRELGGVDYADLEQLALRLLQDAKTARPSATAREWQERLKYIFVDEYQDINPAQDAILSALSRGGAKANRFLVGDVKQSIYRFRRANPRIFAEYERQWGKSKGPGKRIPLAENYRSAESLLRFVNLLMAALQRETIGGIGYPPDAQLTFGAPEERTPLTVAANAEPRVELHLIDTAESGDSHAAWEETGGDSQELLEMETMEREARLATVLLRKVQSDGTMVWCKEAGKLRPVEWRDMAILLRSPRGRAEAFAKQFSLAGIPVQVTRLGFFEMLEVSDLVNLLRLLDNPLQDIPLLAVLHSPLAGLALDELAQLRVAVPRGDLWTALHLFRRTGSNSAPSPDALSARAKVDQFLDRYGRWRELSRQSSLSECLERILDDTAYESLLLAEPQGEERAANVRRLLALTREYDPYLRQGLYRFLRFVTNQEEEESEESPASVQEPNAVRLMSIHAAKGLEFPIVVLPALGVQFNQRDLRENILLHETYGICPRVQPPGFDQSYPSLMHWVAARAERRELTGEEMRLLYVAITRAQERLILVGTRAAPQWIPGPARAIADHQILKGRSFLDWLLLWLPNVTPAESDASAGRTDLLTWRVYPVQDPSLARPTATPTPASESVSVPSVPQRQVDKLCHDLQWQYPFRPATVEPAVKRLTALVHDRFHPGEAQKLFSEAARVEFLTGPIRAARRTGLTAREAGSAHHTFLQLVDLSQVSSKQDLLQEGTRLLESGDLTEQQFAAIDLDALLHFWGSKLGQRILKQPRSQVHREISFTARFSPAELQDLDLCPQAEFLDGEWFIVRGQADLAVIAPEAIWVVDFKTDQVEPAAVGELVERYGRQLKLYGLALSRIFGLPVTETCLHFLALRETFAL